MARRKIKRRRGEGIAISGPATVRVSRGVTLTVNLARAARVDRLKRLPVAQTQIPPQDRGKEKDLPQIHTDEHR